MLPFVFLNGDLGGTFILQGQRRTQTKDRIQNTPKVGRVSPSLGERRRNLRDKIGVEPIKEQEGANCACRSEWQAR